MIVIMKIRGHANKRPSCTYSYTRTKSKQKEASPVSRSHSCPSSSSSSHSCRHTAGSTGNGGQEGKCKGDPRAARKTKGRQHTRLASQQLCASPEETKAFLGGEQRDTKREGIKEFLPGKPRGRHPLNEETHHDHSSSSSSAFFFAQSTARHDEKERHEERERVVSLG